MIVLQKNFIFCGLLMALFVYCNPEKNFPSPIGYELMKPDKIKLPHILNEISGICFRKGAYDTIYAIEDETGNLYKYSLSAKTVSKSRFYSKADYEDLAIFQDSLVVVLKSNAELYSFPMGLSWMKNIEKVTVYESLLPVGEYEGLFAKDNKWYALCKNCKGDNQKKEVTVYEIQPSLAKGPNAVTPIKIKFSKVRETVDAKKENFHPSCLAYHPITHEWYIISSVNHELLILDEQWNAKELFELDPSIFKQPEGIAFNDKGDLFISNEAAGTTANILRFNYHIPVKK